MLLDCIQNRIVLSAWNGEMILLDNVRERHQNTLTLDHHICESGQDPYLKVEDNPRTRESCNKINQQSA